MAESLQDTEEKIKQVERKLAQVSKHLEQNHQQLNKRSDLVREEILFGTKAELEKALLKYNEESKMSNEDKLSQEELAFKLEQQRDKICGQHAAARKELKKILTSISLTLNLIKPETSNLGAVKRGAKVEAPVEIQDERLNDIFSKQELVECKVINLRSKHYCRAKLHQEASSSFQHYSQEIKFLELHVMQENLTRKLELAQDLHSKQFQLKNYLKITQDRDNSQIKSMALDGISLKSDLIMSKLAHNQASTSYKTLQSQHSELWNQVEEANTTVDLTDLANLRKQQSEVLHSIDQEMKNMRKKCEFLDRRLNYYSKIKKDDQC